MSIDHPAVPALKAKFPGVAFKGSDFKGDVQIVLPRERLLEVVTFLKQDAALNYNMLSDISCVDYLNFSGAPREGRFGLVYILNSIPAQGGAGTPRLILRVFLDEPALEVDSLTPLFFGAEWLEREVFDMFGIKFKGHPDLRRILTWDGFKAHPLRKDYPVTGRGERENYPVVERDSA
jgi:NADH-quinone oxidoreductase subunit C